LEACNPDGADLSREWITSTSIRSSTGLVAKSVDELIALSKAKPGTLNYLTASRPLVVYMDRLHNQQDADWVRVPFKGGADSVNAMLTGATPVSLLGEGNIIGHIQAGTVTPLVMLNNIRSPNFPNVPTLEDVGYRGAVSRAWFGLFVPTGTPRPIVDKIVKEVSSVLAEPAFREKQLTARSLVPGGSVTEKFADELKRDRAGAGQVVKAAGLTPQ
jgi:tripartite-type tricarboxylate transporter receptor subunit TctC